MAYVRKNKEWRRVVNLGWLLRHKHEVHIVMVFTDRYLMFLLDNNLEYVTQFADASIMQKFIDKRWPESECPKIDYDVSFANQFPHYLEEFKEARWLRG